MKSADRILWAIGIVLIDLVTIGVPLAAIFAAYILIARPPWFKKWVERAYKD